MNTSLAAYYSNELDEWKDVIHFHVQEIEEFEVWLTEVLRHNTVTDLAARTEHFFTAFAGQRHHFEQLAGQVYGLQSLLVKDGGMVGDEEITPEMEKSHNTLREQMLQNEKKFLDLKYSCQKFLSDTLGRQSRGKTSGPQEDGPTD